MQLGAIAVFLISSALGQTAPDRAAIDKRLQHKVDLSAKLALEDGDTLFIEKRELVPSKRLVKKLPDYEGLVTGITAPKGVVVHARVDEVKLEALGDKTAVIFRYAIHAEPGAASNGKISLTLNLVERTGLANTVVSVKQATQVAIATPKPSTQDLTADFWGYRTYRKLAESKAASLEKKSIRGLSIADEARLPSLERAPPDVALEVYEFERARRRIWVAHRHLTAAKASKDAKIAGAAKLFLDSLDKPDDQLSGLPGADARPQEEPTSSSGVVTLKPERVEPAGGTGKTSQGTGSTLSPVTSYEPGTEGDDDLVDTEPAKEPQQKKPDKPIEVAKADPNATQTNNADPGFVPGSVATQSEDDFLQGRSTRREIPIPSYPRALVLDDPNIAHGGGIRFSYASVNVGGTAGIAPALFYFAQTAITRFVGLELTIPTVLVDLDVPRARTRYLMGNPLVAGKWRFHLPEIEGRRPVLTLRGRWGIPISPLNTIPPTTRGAESFSRPAHYDDPYAFTLEKSDFGLGVSSAYQLGMIYTGVQLYADYFYPVGDSLDRLKFTTLSWGASVGLLPLKSEVLGIHLEGRSTTLISGPGRTDFFAYLGVRSRFIDNGEGAVWVTLPLGAVNRISGFQLGVEVRFFYDVEDAIPLGTGLSGQERPLVE